MGGLTVGGHSVTVYLNRSDRVMDDHEAKNDSINTLDDNFNSTSNASINSSPNLSNKLKDEKSVPKFWVDKYKKEA
ncbi:18565_t:CDS:1, partial [Acaulospora morrowiae]